MSRRYEGTLRKLALRDDRYIDGLLADSDASKADSRLDQRTHALVRLAALIAIDAATPSYLEAIDAARASAVTNDEIVGCLVALLPAIGVARVVSAAPKVGLALGYDIDAALEWPRGRAGDAPAT
jgi:4-carboxymuconolactone decarboxylase